MRHLNLSLIYRNIIISKLKHLRNSIIILHLEQAQSLSHFTLALCYNFPTLQIFLFYIGNSAILINIFLIFLSLSMTLVSSALSLQRNHLQWSFFSSLLRFFNDLLQSSSSVSLSVMLEFLGHGKVFKPFAESINDAYHDFPCSFLESYRRYSFILIVFQCALKLSVLWLRLESKVNFPKFCIVWVVDVIQYEFIHGLVFFFCVYCLIWDNLMASSLIS